jgi:opacity protein-like surface antigen
MKLKKNILLLLSIIFFAAVVTQSLYSQESDINLEAGKKYKIILFDDTEIIGRVISIDKNSVKIQTSSGETIHVLKENILYASTDLTPKHYKFSFSLLGGTSLLADNYYHYYYTSDKKSLSGIHADITGLFYLSDSKAIKLDMSYSHFKGQDYTSESYGGYPPSYYSSGSVTYFSFKPNIVLGYFKPKERFIGYGSLGIGIHYTKEGEWTEQWYNTYDSTYRIYTTPERSYVNAVFSLGGGVGYRITDNLGIHGEIEYNLITSDASFLFFGGRGYFPLRIGVTYMLF